jgi:hypothetical protein
MAPRRGGSFRVREYFEVLNQADGRSTSLGPRFSSVWYPWTFGHGQFERFGPIPVKTLEQRSALNHVRIGEVGYMLTPEELAEAACDDQAWKQIGRRAAGECGAKRHKPPPALDCN